MLTNPRADRVRALRRLATRSVRQQERRFLVEGPQAVREALNGRADGVVVRELFADPEGSAAQRSLVAAAEAADIPVRLASHQVMAALSETVTPQGIVAVCDFIDRPLSSLTAVRPGLVAVLADVRDPGNAGSVMRAADAAGAHGMVFAGSSVDPYNGKVVRASVGGIFHVPLVVENSVSDSIAEVKRAGLQVLVADGEGDLDLDDAAQRGMLGAPTAWVFGNEAWGVPATVQELADHVVRIPIYGRAESLNLATAATLCLYASARAARKSP